MVGVLVVGEEAGVELAVGSGAVEGLGELVLSVGAVDGLAGDQSAGAAGLAVLDDDGAGGDLAVLGGDLDVEGDRLPDVGAPAGVIESVVVVGTGVMG